MVAAFLRTFGRKAWGWALLVGAGLVLFLAYERARARAAAAVVELAREKRKPLEADVERRGTVLAGTVARVTAAEDRLRAADLALAEARASRDALRRRVDGLLTPEALGDRADRLGV